MNAVISKKTQLSGVMLALGLIFTPLLNAEKNNENEHLLKKVIASKHRSDAQKTRDEFRHPQQTLEFFGVHPTMKLVEIWPGGGWYTDILAPFLKDKGHFVAAHFDPDSGVKYYTRSLDKFKKKVAANQAVYGDFDITVFNPPKKVAMTQADSADMVLTFRNVHNWYMRGEDKSVKAAFAGMFKVLKPGGVLGVVEHRLPEDRDQKKAKRSGYMKQSLVVKWATEAGFKLVAESDINANKKDTADHPEGVWTLPPSLRLGDKDKAKYQAIGESDRMTLKFVKPAVR